VFGSTLNGSRVSTVRKQVNPQTCFAGPKLIRNIEENIYSNTVCANVFRDNHGFIFSSHSLPRIFSRNLQAPLFSAACAASSSFCLSKSNAFLFVFLLHRSVQVVAFSALAILISISHSALKLKKKKKKTEKLRNVQYLAK